MGYASARILAALFLGAAWFPALAAAATAEPLRGAARDDKGHMCVFCHRMADSYAQPAAPEWQPSLQGDAVYPLFPVGNPSEAGLETVSGSRSVVCLACHESDDTRGSGEFRYGHPFGIPYRGAQETNSSGAAHPNPAYYVWSAGRMSTLTPHDFRPPRRGPYATTWQVAVPGADVALPLFVRVDSAANGAPFVECETCHDPHSSRPAFMRVPAARLCLACHNI